MILFFKKLHIKNKEKRSTPKQAGMTLLELLVVLSIFIIMSSIAIFNYGGFQGKVDIKNLANDIALKIVAAQRSSLSGQLPSVAQQPSMIFNWKPSYGLYFNLSTSDKSFINFTDLNNNNTYDGSDCAGECSSKISITRGDNISRIDVFYQGDTPSSHSVPSLNDLTISFTRPDPGATITSTTTLSSNLIDYAQITINSPQSVTSKIKVYAPGRIQIN